MSTKAPAASRLRALAYHEAGHALGLWRGRLPLKSITIEPTEYYLGRVSHGLRVREDHFYSMSPRTRDRLERLIVSMLAAREAQRLVSRRYDHVGASDDRKHILDLVLRITGSAEEARPYLGWLRLRAKGLVNNPTGRRALDALATVLLERRTLTGTEAVRVMHGAAYPGLPPVDQMGLPTMLPTAAELKRLIKKLTDSAAQGDTARHARVATSTKSGRKPSKAALSNTRRH